MRKNNFKIYRAFIHLLKIDIVISFNEDNHKVKREKINKILFYIIKYLNTLKIFDYSKNYIGSDNIMNLNSKKSKYASTIDKISWLKYFFVNILLISQDSYLYLSH